MSAQVRLEALKLAVSLRGLVGVENVMEAAKLFEDYMSGAPPVVKKPELVQDIAPTPPTPPTPPTRRITKRIDK